MIFNPYELTHLQTETATAASLLSWSEPQIQDNAVVVGLLLCFIAADVLAWCPKGVMRHQLQWIVDTRNARTFESVVVNFPWLKSVLILQAFFSFGLALFSITDSAAGTHLLHPDGVSLTHLGLCASALMGWFMLQWALVSWVSYLFGLKEKSTIMTRSYQASFVVLAPFATICLVALISGLTSAEMTLNLLAALFILSQITFIFNGFKIFYEGFGSLCLIFVYLCALEFAPLYIIWAKIVTE